MRIRFQELQKRDLRKACKNTAPMTKWLLRAWYMTLFPDAVLVETITFLPCERAVIAATWCVYSDVIFRELRNAWTIESDKGGSNSAVAASMLKSCAEITTQYIPS